MKKGAVVGVDEAGRGPLAGPVFVSAMFSSHDGLRHLKGVRDCKKLTPLAREKWYKKILDLKKRKLLYFSVSSSSARLIDEIGISRSIRIAVARSIKSLHVSPKTEVLLDGTLLAPKIYTRQRTIIGGDDKIRVISAASVVAKVRRDRKMNKLSKKYPKYNFNIHKGYGTKLHYARIKKHGLSKIHRRSFLKNI